MKRKCSLLVALASFALSVPAVAAESPGNPVVTAAPPAATWGGKAESGAGSRFPLKTSLATEGWIALRGNSGFSFRDHHSMDLYTTDDSLLSRGVGLGVDVWRYQGLLALAVEGDWAFEKGSSNGVLGGAFHSWYTHQEYNLGVSLRCNLGRIHPVLTLISPHVRLFGSLAATKQQLADKVRSTTYRTGYQKTGGGGAAAGFTVRSPSLTTRSERAFPALSLGVRVEAGYGFFGDPEFRLNAVDDSEHPIELRGASLGRLELDAAFLRASLELRL